MEQSKKNVIKVFAVLSLLLLALIMRLGFIQIIEHTELASAERAQSMLELEGGNTRGIIYDRNGEALVADKLQYVYIIKNSNYNNKAEKLLKKMKANKVSGDNEGYQVYYTYKYNKLLAKKLKKCCDAYIMETSARYSNNQIAPHVIGYINKRDLSGAAGIELMYDDKLSGLNRQMHVAADVKGNILPGRGVIISDDGGKDSYINEGVTTTLDKDIQEKIENIAEKSKKNCAIVVLDCKTGGIAAMASTPKFNPNNISYYIDRGGDELINKATQGEYPPGSVFKIVVAAAALENGVSNKQTYYCNGKVQVGDITIKCDTGGEAGHGQISFEEAFAKSCNCFFISLGQSVGAEEIIDTAEKLGLGNETLDNFPQEAKGHLMDEDERVGNAIGNLSIGQGELLVTPVQISKMTNIIANDGLDKGVNLILDDQLDNKYEELQIMSANTADYIKNMMEKTITDGTAAGLKLIDDRGEALAAAKTGTAQYETREGTKNHGWITGYIPCDSPEYVITVFVENCSSGAGDAGPIFKKIVNYLKDTGELTMPFPV